VQAQIQCLRLLSRNVALPPQLLRACGEPPAFTMASSPPCPSSSTTQQHTQLATQQQQQQQQQQRAALQYYYQQQQQQQHYQLQLQHHLQLQHMQLQPTTSSTSGDQVVSMIHDREARIKDRIQCRLAQLRCTLCCGCGFIRRALTIQTPLFSTTAESQQSRCAEGSHRTQGTPGEFYHEVAQLTHSLTSIYQLLDFQKLMRSRLARQIRKLTMEDAIASSVYSFKRDHPHYDVNKFYYLVKFFNFLKY
jgi:hypothetical protein